MEIVQDVANKLKTDWEYGDSVEAIKMKILLTMLGEGFEETSDREREELMEEFEEAGVRGADWTKGFPVGAIMAQVGVRMSGFLAYQIAVIVANGVARAIIGRGLSVAGNIALREH